MKARKIQQGEDHGKDKIVMWRRPWWETDCKEEETVIGKRM